MTKKNTAAEKPANPCPNAGSVIIDEATAQGIDQMCNNVTESLFFRLKKLFTAAVLAAQCADDAPALAGVRNMMEWQLADMFENIEKDCAHQLEFHVNGLNPFANVQPEILAI